MIVLVILSIIRAYKRIRELEFIIFGGFLYAFLYCLNVSILTSDGFLSTLIMFLALLYNLFLIFELQVFREAKSKSFKINFIKTFVQILSVWTICLLIIPLVILNTIPPEIPSSLAVQLISVIIFFLFSFLGLYSAITLVKYGEGTPLPTDQTTKLVIKGPYKYVRNPMAIAGIGQGLSVAMYFNSLPLHIYNILGMIIWHIIVRVFEEKNMRDRFGKEYDSYSKRVPLWFPKIRL